MVALHKDRFVFPVRIAVTRVSGSGADSIFMGVIKPLEQDPDTIKAWILPTGNILCVDLRFTDWLGIAPADCVGKHMSSLVSDPVSAPALLDTRLCPHVSL